MLPFLINDTIIAELFGTNLIFIYRFDRQPAAGIVNPATCFLAGHLEVMTPNGNLIGVSYSDLKAVCFVSDSGQPDLFDTHPFFDRRPKTPGLWTRFTFRDGSKVDGVLSHNLLEWPEQGYLVTPPHAGPNRQRVFIPRLALVSTDLRGVVGTSASSALGRNKALPTGARQLPMFE
jgi:hypothetical protein